MNKRVQPILIGKEELYTDGKRGLLDISRRRFCAYYLLAVFIFYVWYQATMNVLNTGELIAYHGMLDLVVGFTINFSMVLLLSVINTLIICGIRWQRNRAWRIVFDFILSLGAPVLINLIFIGISALFGMHPIIEWLQGFVLNFMIFMINEVAWYMINYKNSQYLYQNTLRVAAQLENDVLRAQVNPHFLFNSLNILYSLTMVDIEKSQKFILSLSKMYRYLISRRDSLVIPLSDELQFLESYVEVLQMLYYGCFEVEIKNKEKVGGQHLLPYSMQLLIENVTKHNVIHKGSPMRVTIELQAEKMIVSNPIQLKSEEKNDSSGVGLQYLTRLYNLYGKEFRYEETLDHRFVVEVPYIDKTTKNSDKTIEL